jgi:DNA-binding NarL/FixJ family response regulator
VAQGLDNRDIAGALFVGEGTVRNHISSVLQKLRLRNRTQIAVMYYRAGRG